MKDSVLSGRSRKSRKSFLGDPSEINSKMEIDSLLVSNDDGSISEKKLDTEISTNETTVLEPLSTLDSFNLLKCIGTGSFGTVYLAQNKVSGRFFAIKALRKEMIKKKN